MVVIGISGTHSSGKTTTMDYLKQKYPKLNLVSEAARDCPYPINENTSFESQEWIFRTQIKRELDAPLNDITISDRTVYDQLAYVKYAYQHHNITYAEYDMLEKRILAWGKTYDLIAYIPIQFGLVDDGVRSKSEEYRKEIDDFIQNILESYVPNKYVVLRGPPSERSAILERELLKLTSGFDHGE